MYIDALVSTTRLKPVRACNEIITAGYINDITEILPFIMLLKARPEEIGSAAASRVSCAKPPSFKVRTIDLQKHSHIPIFTTAPTHQQINPNASSTSPNPPVEA